MKKRAKRPAPAKPSFLGHWDIIESEDMDVERFYACPASISFETEKKSRSAGAGHGELQIGALQAEIDWRAGEKPGSVEFSWDGSEEGDQVNGRGKAWVDDGGHLWLTVYYHLGDQFSFICERNG